MRKTSGVTRQATAGARLVGLVGVVASLSGCADPERSRASSCANNLKELGTALLAYTQGYDECFPSVAYETPSGATVGTIKGVVFDPTGNKPAPDALLPVMYP